jgi:hypothetical protein
MSSAILSSSQNIRKRYAKFSITHIFFDQKGFNLKVGYVSRLLCKLLFQRRTLSCEGNNFRDWPVGQVRQVGEDVSQVSIGVNAMVPTAFDESVEAGTTLADIGFSQPVVVCFTSLRRGKFWTCCGSVAGAVVKMDFRKEEVKYQKGRIGVLLVSDYFHASCKNMETGRMPVLRLKLASLRILTSVFSEIIFGDRYGSPSTACRI